MFNFTNLKSGNIDCSFLPAFDDKFPPPPPIVAPSYNVRIESVPSNDG